MVRRKGHPVRGCWRELGSGNEARTDLRLSNANTVYCSRPVNEAQGICDLQMTVYERVQTGLKLSIRIDYSANFACRRNEEVLPTVFLQDQVFITVLGNLSQNVPGELAEGEKIVIDGLLLGDERVQLGMPARV
jgi:hypothetical protein